MPWLIRLRGADRPLVTIYCVPQAGGAHTAYRTWRDWAPDWLDVVGVSLPGRLGRDVRPTPTSFAQVADELTTAITHDATRSTLPFGIFGHSMGALLAYEVTRRLPSRWMACHLFVSGHGAPHVFSTSTRLHEMSSAEATDALRRDGGTPAAILDQPELMAYYLRILQADLSLLAEHDPDPVVPVEVPLTAFFGFEDATVPTVAVDAWRDLTTQRFRCVGFPGGHFFPGSAARHVVAEVVDDLARHVAVMT